MNIRRHNITEEIFNVLYERINSEYYKPGAKLPSQDKLAEELGVSRNSLREAINRLTMLGALTTKQGIGTIVSPKRVSAAHIETFESLSLTPKDGLEIIEFRLALERTIVRLAAVKRTEKALKKLEENLLSQHDALLEKDMMLFKQLDIEFHTLLATASNNKTFSRLIETNLDLFRGLIATAIGPASIQASYDKHQVIFNAISANDPIEADHAMMRHLFGIIRLLPKHDEYVFLNKAFLDT